MTFLHREVIKLFLWEISSHVFNVKVGHFHLALHHVLGLKFYFLVAATTFMMFLRILFSQVFS